MRSPVTKTGIVLATALAVGLTSFAPSPLWAGSPSPAPASVTKGGDATDFSAARKHRRHARHYRGNGGAAAAAAFAGIVGTIGAIAAANARRDDYYYYDRPGYYYGPPPGYYRPYGYYGYRAW